MIPNPRIIQSFYLQVCKTYWHFYSFSKDLIFKTRRVLVTKTFSANLFRSTPKAANSWTVLWCLCQNQSNNNPLIVSQVHRTKSQKNLFWYLPTIFRLIFCFVCVPNINLISNKILVNNFFLKIFLFTKIIFNATQVE